MGLFVVYAIGIAALLWYSLFFLPFPELRHNFGFTLNIVQLGFLSLLSFLVYRQETIFRSIFFQFWIAFAVLALSAPAILTCTYLWDWQGGMASYVWASIVTRALLTWIICKILLHYVFHDEKRWAINLISSLVVLPLYIWLFWPYHWNPQALLTLPGAASAATLYLPIRKPLIVVNSVSLFFLLAFFVHKYRTDRPIGVFADTVLALFGGYLLIDTVELAVEASNPILLNISQWAIALVSAAMLVVLMKRLKFKSQTIAEYYESQFLSDHPDIGRRVGFFDRVVLRLFFDPEKIGKRIYLDTGHQRLQVKRTSHRIQGRPDGNG